MVLPKILEILFTFVLTVSAGVKFYEGIATIGMTNNLAIRSDVISSSMSLINMHPHTEVNLSWDFLPFSIGVSEGDITGAVGMFFPTETATFSSYPLSVPFYTTQTEDNIHYLSRDNVSKFYFRNLGTPEAKME